ncbi:MAG: NADH-quinone oxidoreductase subunit B [Proteobacteria bacterium]|nr:NADH-quinone oxidoreductase subunit B [Pseudomonadota bacterium]
MSEHSLTVSSAEADLKNVAFTTRLEDFINWGRKNSLWPLPFGTACCAIEYMATVGSHYDVSRFGAEVVRFSPRQADCLLVLGTVVEKMGPVLKQVYDQMLEPKWVIAVGVCASSGGFYRAYHVMQGIDNIIPVDVYVPGCPPTPEGIIFGLLKLQEKIKKGGIVRARDRHKIAR